MIASEEIFEDRKKAYYEQQRILLARLMSERGGLLTKDATEKENESKAVNFFKELAVLEYKFIDVVRDEWGKNRVLQATDYAWGNITGARHTSKTNTISCAIGRREKSGK